MLAGTAATVVAVLVNGHEIIRTIIEKPPVEGEEPPQNKYYNLQVRTVDEQGATCTELDLMFPEKLYLQAWIEAYGEGANADDGGPISIELQSGYEYVQLTECAPFTNGRTVLIEPVASAPQGQSDLSATILVSAPLDGQPFSAPVTIRLVRGGFEMKFSGGESYA
ncbi:MAG: hypothetical protein N2491_03145 [Negativicutes bacterium]|nr:hypothetical protein [Negativicutes bacterium]